jgi:glycosyltransferase involved in cell wall biosynthesis
MGSRPSVSIVVMNHNYGHFVGDALSSAVGQEPGQYDLAEVVVIDDGSTDRSHQVFADFPGVRRVLKPHEGFGPTLTRAVEEARGDWVAPLDADDAFLPHKLRVAAPLLADEDLLFLQHAEYVVDEAGRPYAEGTHPGGSTSTLLVRTDAARALLPVTNELFFHVLADLGYGRRMEDPLTRYRVHDRSMTDRRTPGASATFMAKVCIEVAAGLDQLAKAPPPWASMSQLTDLATGYRAKADQHQEAAREQRRAAPPSQTAEPSA